MTKEEILDYILQTPENTNRRVLSDMLDEFSSGGSGGNSDIFIVTYTDDENDEGTLTCDKTLAEITAAMEAGKIIIAKEYEVGGNNGAYLTYSLGHFVPEDSEVTFTSIREHYKSSQSTHIFVHTITHEIYNEAEKITKLVGVYDGEID